MADRATATWRKFRSWKTRWQVAAWIGLLLVVGAIGDALDGETGSTATTVTVEAPPAERPAAKAERVSEAPHKPPTRRERLAAHLDAEADYEQTVVDAIEDTDSTSNGEAACPKLRTCSVTYEVELLGLFQDREMVMLQQQVWEAVFADRRVREGTILMSGEVESVGGKLSVEPILKVRCDRSAADQIDWDRVDLEGIEILCDYRELVNFD